MTYWDALYFTRQRRNKICPNMGFAKQLQSYENTLKARKLANGPLNNSIVNLEKEMSSLKIESSSGKNFNKNGLSV